MLDERAGRGSRPSGSRRRPCSTSRQRTYDASTSAGVWNATDGRLLVGALAQPHPRALDRERAAVVLGAVQVGLHDRAGLREVAAQRPQRRERRVGRGVVLHVEGHRRAGGRGRLADRARALLERELVADRLADGATASPTPRCGRRRSARPRASRSSSDEVGLDGRVGLAGVGGVLAEVVEADRQALADELAAGAHGVLDGLAGDEAAHDAARRPARRRRSRSTVALREAARIADRSTGMAGTVTPSAHAAGPVGHDPRELGAAVLLQEVPAAGDRRVRLAGRAGDLADQRPLAAAR